MKNVYVLHHEMKLFNKFNKEKPFPKAYAVLSHDTKFSENQFEEMVDEVIERAVYTGELFSTIEEKLISKYGFERVETMGLDTTQQMHKKLGQ